MFTGTAKRLVDTLKEDYNSDYVLGYLQAILEFICHQDPHAEEMVKRHLECVRRERATR